MTPTLRTWPKSLAAADTVGVIAPSGPLSPERIASGIDKLNSWGLSVAPGKHLHDRHRRLGYLAGDDADRADDFMTAWTDPDVSAVWCARGGYGAQRMIDLLDFGQLRAAGPKHLIGFSDITALHARIGRELGQVTIHGPTAASRQLDDPDSVASLRSLAFATPERGQQLVTGDTLVPGAAGGRLIGGNLSLIADDLGVEPPPGEPVIAVFEEVGEEGYRIDRMLTQLRRSGWFHTVAGIVLGQFSEADDPEQVQALLEDRLAELGIPVLADAPVGHTDHNRTLPLGAQVWLDAHHGVLTLA
jgi:muramoyltetrapeptide carboxypeptidase